MSYWLIGVCNYCLESGTFMSERAREVWEEEHAALHEPEPVSRWEQDTVAGAIGEAR